MSKTNVSVNVRINDVSNILFQVKMDPSSARPPGIQIDYLIDQQMTDMERERVRLVKEITQLHVDKCETASRIKKEITQLKLDKSETASRLQKEIAKLQLDKSESDQVNVRLQKELEQLRSMAAPPEEVAQGTDQHMERWIAR